MIKKDLFEVLREKLHCEYISDLRFVDYESIRVHIKNLDYNDFTLKEMIDAIVWFGGLVPNNISREKAWSILVSLNKR